MKLRLTASIKKADAHQDLVEKTKDIVERLKKHFEDKNLPQEVRDTIEQAIPWLEWYPGMLGRYRTDSRKMSEMLRQYKTDSRKTSENSRKTSEELSKILSGEFGKKIEDKLNIKPGDKEDNTLELIRESLKQMAEKEKEMAKK